LKELGVDARLIFKRTLYKCGLFVEWIKVTHGRVQWRAHMDTVTKVRVL